VTKVPFWQITQGLFPREQRGAENEGILLITDEAERWSFRPVDKIQRSKPMTSNIRPLNESELTAVTGGGATLSLNTANTIVLPHIPQAKDLLTPDQVSKLLSINSTFNPPIPHG
jgi:hypothetical protein